MIVASSFHFHYARLIEVLYALERIGALWAMSPFWTRGCGRTPE